MITRKKFSVIALAMTMTFAVTAPAPAKTWLKTVNLFGTEDDMEINLRTTWNNVLHMEPEFSQIALEQNERWYWLNDGQLFKHSLSASLRMKFAFRFRGRFRNIRIYDDLYFRRIPYPFIGGYNSPELASAYPAIYSVDPLKSGLSGFQIRPDVLISMLFDYIKIRWTTPYKDLAFMNKWKWLTRMDLGKLYHSWANPFINYRVYAYSGMMFYSNLDKINATAESYFGRSPQYDKGAGGLFNNVAFVSRISPRASKGWKNNYFLGTMSSPKADAKFLGGEWAYRQSKLGNFGNFTLNANFSLLHERIKASQWILQSSGSSSLTDPAQNNQSTTSDFGHLGWAPAWFLDVGTQRYKKTPIVTKLAVHYVTPNYWAYDFGKMMVNLDPETAERDPLQAFWTVNTADQVGGRNGERESVGLFMIVGHKRAINPYKIELGWNRYWKMQYNDGDSIYKPELKRPEVSLKASTTLRVKHASDRIKKLRLDKFKYTPGIGLKLTPRDADWQVYGDTAHPVQWDWFTELGMNGRFTRELYAKLYFYMPVFSPWRKPTDDWDDYGSAPVIKAQLDYYVHGSDYQVVSIWFRTPWPGYSKSETILYEGRRYMIPGHEWEPKCDQYLQFRYKMYFR